jgi:hypothetical protein
MTLPSLDTSSLLIDDLSALAETYAQEARSLLLPGLLREGEKMNHPDLVEPLGIEQLEQIATNRGIVRIDTEATIASDGQLIPLPQGGFRLRIAAGSNRHRSRFTMAHEIAHTYFRDAWEPSNKGRYRARPDGYSSKLAVVEERFCDLFAACLLLPKKSALAEFRQLADLRAPSELASKIEQIAARWGVSTLATLRRLNETAGLPAGMIAVVLRWTVHRSKRNQPACRVESFFPYPIASWYLPPNKRACTIGMDGANALFEHWHSVRQLDRARGGYWTLRTDDEGHTVIRNASAESGDIAERLTVWVKSASDPWRKMLIYSIVNYRLYAAARSKPYCLAFASVPIELTNR